MALPQKTAVSSPSTLYSPLSSRKQTHRGSPRDRTGGREKSAGRAISGEQRQADRRRPIRNAPPTVLPLCATGSSTPSSSWQTRVKTLAGEASRGNARCPRTWVRTPRNGHLERGTRHQRGIPRHVSRRGMPAPPRWLCQLEFPRCSFNACRRGFAFPCLMSRRAAVACRFRRSGRVCVRRRCGPRGPIARRSCGPSPDGVPAAGPSARRTA